MPTNNTSRYKNIPLFLDDTSDDKDTLYYGTRLPIKYIDDPDTTIHVIKEGDTLQKLANAYYKGFSSPSTLWWVIAEFQQTPIVDPTIKLKPGTLLNIPSSNLVSSIINKSALDRLI